MKLEGWVAVGDDGKDWMADSSKEFLLKNVAKSKDEFTDINWEDPVPCIITTPDPKTA